MSFIILIAVCILSIIAGYLIAMIRYDRKVEGVLRVDMSDPEDGPYLFVELSGDPSRLEHGRYVRFWVSKTNYISQK